MVATSLIYGRENTMVGMQELSTRNLAVLHLDAVNASDADAAAYGRSIPGVIEALGVGDAVAGRVELLTTLRALQEDGLVTSRERSVEGLSEPRSTYELTPAGADAADALLAEIGDETVVVEREDGRETVAVADLPEAVPELAFVRALVETTADRVLTLHDEGMPFVDRSDEVATLETCLHAVRDGAGEAVLVSGDHGMGKTALVESVLADAGTDLTVYSGAARESMSEPYAAFRAAFESVREDAPAQLFEGSESLEGANLEQRRRSFFHDVADFLDDLGSTGPVAVFLNDLERADPATISLFEFLSETIEDSGVLLVGAVTPTATADDHPLTGSDGEFPDGLTVVELEGFDVAATATFLEAELDDTGIPRGFVEAMTELTGGNPQFLSASVSYMVENGTIDPRNSYYPTAASELSVPEGIQSVILERIESVDAEGEKVLEAGSVVGETVPRDVLEAVVDLDSGAVDACVDRLLDVGVWRRGEGSRLRFTSNVVRDVVHEQLDASTRERIHERVANALQDVYADDLSAHAAEIARHYRDAGDHERAIEWFERAGEHAASVYAYETGIEAYERAVELARDAERDATVVSLLTAIGRMHMHSDDYDEALRYFEYVTQHSDDTERRGSIAAERAKMHVDRGKYEAAVEAVEDGLADWDGETHSEAICTLLVRKAHALSAMAESDAAREIADRALSIAQALESDELRARALKARGIIEHYTGNFERSVAFEERAAEAAAAADAERLLAAIYNNIAGAKIELGDAPAAVDAFERSRERWQAIGNRVGEVVPLGNIGYTKTKLGEFDAAREYLEESARLGGRLGMDGHRTYMWRYLADLDINVGELERARDYAERSLELATEINQERTIHADHAHLSRIARLEDDHETALEHVEAVRAESGDAQQEVLSEAEYYRGLIRREQGDVAEAIEIHEAALDEAASIPHWKPPVIQRIGLAMAYVDADRAEEAVEHAASAVEDASDAGNVLFQIGSRTALARATLATGDVERAESIIREVLADAIDIGSKTYEGQARLVLAAVRREQGEEAAARDQLETTVEIASEYGIALFERQARDALAALD